METVVLTFTYPAVAAYLDDFLRSLSMQTSKSFDLLIVNDGLCEVEKYVAPYHSLNVTIVNCASTPAKNREFGLKMIKEKGYKTCIMADSDDCFSVNRVEESIKSLQTVDVVVNDISLIEETGNVKESHYFSNRLQPGQMLDYKFIKTKSVFGFTNTAFNTCIIPSDLTFPENLKIVDWYFYTLLLHKGKSAVFNANAVTFYRQSANNIIGINNVTEKEYQRRYQLKHDHYAYISIIIPELLSYKKAYAADEKTYKNHYKKFINNKISIPFWWEDI